MSKGHSRSLDYGSYKPRTLKPKPQTLNSGQFRACREDLGGLAVCRFGGFRALVLGFGVYIV